VERVKKQVRLEFLCGARAIRRARADFELLSEVAVGGSAAIEEVPAIVSGLRDQLKTAQATRKTLTEELNRYRAAGLVGDAPVGADGIKRIQVQPNGASMEELRGLAQAVVMHPRTCFAGVAEPATLILATSADSGLDAGSMLREALTRVGGKGGGNARMAQGGLPPGADASGLLRLLGFD
jgi:alanyl-tRNA synthetase